MPVSTQPRACCFCSSLNCMPGTLSPAQDLGKIRVTPKVPDDAPTRVGKGTGPARPPRDRHPAFPPHAASPSLAR